MIRVPMIFPGQASQAVGMASDLAAVGGVAAAFLREVDAVVGAPLMRLMFEGPADELTETRNAQPAILAHSVAIALALREAGIGPSIAAGHSLGEYSAAVAVGALAPADGLRAVRRRGELMFAAGEERAGTMAAVIGLPAAEVAKVCRTVAQEYGIVVVANHNSAQQIAISGEEAAVAAAGVALKEAGARRFIPLNVSGAFHSPLLEEASAAFRTFLQDLSVADPDVPLVANVSGRPVRSAAELREGFARQLTAPVLWQDTMDVICGARGGEPPSLVLEVGPGKVLTNLARRTYPEVEFATVGTAAELAEVIERLAGSPA